MVRVQSAFRSPKKRMIMDSILLKIYDTKGPIDLWEVKEIVGNDSTTIRELFLLSDSINSFIANVKVTDLEVVIIETVTAALVECDGIQKEAALLLGISARSVCYYVEKYDIQLAMSPRKKLSIERKNRRRKRNDL